MRDSFIIKSIDNKNKYYLQLQLQTYGRRINQFKQK